MDLERHKTAVVSSALWAAAGDAVGWISELADPDGLARRIGGASAITGTIAWRRKVYSRGPIVELPAGTYSDDTQLRLAVCRTTRATGQFDVEAFAKIELPIWLSYSLGAGKGTTAAATSLCKSSVNWFSNFFESGEQGYFKAGGNGAAMRVQPHVWKHAPTEKSEFLLDVLKDAISTHGHPHGFCGAIFHALCLGFALNHRKIPGPEFWSYAARMFGDIEDLIQTDRQLRNIWFPAWQDRSRRRLAEVIAETIQETITAIELIRELRSERPDVAYRKMLHDLNLYNVSFRGSGLLTALAASALAWFFNEEKTGTALLVAANELYSDTDTIGTMAGAIMGAARPDDTPKWQIQDSNYIVSEASRLANIAFEVAEDSFSYPDLLHWSSPETQADAVVQLESGMALRGLGRLLPIEPAVEQGVFLWQWMELDFGQTVLVKRRAGALMPGMKTWMPAARLKQSQNISRGSNQEQPQLPLPPQPSTSTVSSDSSHAIGQNRGYSPLDMLTQEAIRSGFDISVIGKTFLEAVRTRASVEDAIGYASILAKAIITRDRR